MVYFLLGMLREAEMIEQQAKAKQAGGGASTPAAMPQTAAAAPMAGLPATAPAAAAPGGGAGQPDYSAQWAEYYRSIGKIKEAEAIEAQMKNKVGISIHIIYYFIVLHLNIHLSVVEYRVHHLNPLQLRPL